MRGAETQHAWAIDPKTRVLALTFCALSVPVLGSMAVCAAVPGKLIPMASMNTAMVLAVNMPPHVPGPGMACSICHCITRVTEAMY